LVVSSGAHSQLNISITNPGSQMTPKQRLVDGVNVGVGVADAEGVLVGVDVSVLVGVRVGFVVRVGVGVGLLVLVTVGVGVLLRVGVSLGLGVRDGVDVGLGVRENDGEGHGVPRAISLSTLQVLICAALLILVDILNLINSLYSWIARQQWASYRLVSSRYNYSYVHPNRR
jgi:hypothetical protein